MGTTADRSALRVVLAARAAADAQRLAEEASALARVLHAELTGLFVEEADLLSVAGLPVTREIGLVSGAVRDIDTTSTTRLLRREADEVRARVERLATHLDLPWSFHVERGDVVEVAAAAASSGLVLLAPRPAAWQRVAGGVPRRPREATVATLYDVTEAGERALETALNLAASPELVTLVLRAGADVEAARRRAAARLGRTARPEVAVWGERPRLRRALVVSLASVDRGELRRLLTVEESPVILVR